MERKELLTIHVIITNTETVTEGDYRHSKIYFTGYCDTEYFHGTIFPGGCDTQEHYMDKLTKIRAEYTLQGVDKEGEKCNIHVVNQQVNGEWKPEIKTDSRSLEWLSHADLTAVLEGSKEGLTVRIFGDPIKVSIK